MKKDPTSIPLNQDSIKWIEKLSWQEFKDSGLLWFINRILHLFGRAIALQYENKTLPDSNSEKERIITGVFFVRCRYRGFGEKQETKGMIDLTNFINDNIKYIKEDID